MDAEFFCLNRHFELAGSLARYLRQYVDPSVALRVRNFDAQDRSERAEFGERYTKLLLASIPPERELNIETVTGIELFGNRVYVRVYWPMLAQGYYQVGGLDVFGTYWTSYQKQFHGGGRGLEKFLPALAIRDRMVLVPSGQTETLESLGKNELPAPPLERGVSEVDFEKPVALQQAFGAIGKTLRNELRTELSAYKSYHPGPIDFDAASASLGVPLSLLQHAFEEDYREKELIVKQLRCRLTPDTVVHNVQTRVVLTIDNPSSVDLGTLRVQLRGPSSGLEINPERVVIELPPRSSVRTDFSMATSRIGEFVLEALFLDASVDELPELLPVQQLWISSRPEGTQ